MYRKREKLLKNQKDQLNGLSQKHLDFYYQDILKQTLQTAKPDNVFVNIELAKKELYSLPKGSLFNAGFDNQKAPILFESISEVQLNPASIPLVFTLCSKEADKPVLNVISKKSSLCLNSINTPNKLLKNEAGEVQSWSTFGNKEEKVPFIKMGFSIASPMFFLREGDRILTVVLTFDKDVTVDVFQNAIFSLSTAKSWLNIPFHDALLSQFDDDTNIISKTGYLIQADPTNAKVFTILINLDKSQPSIAPLLLNDVGIESDWPMFKIEFSEFDNIQLPPALISLAIKVEVNGIETLQLSNQNGALSSLTPFQPFGPIVSLGNSFVIGSDEVYSKRMAKIQTRSC